VRRRINDQPQPSEIINDDIRIEHFQRVKPLSRGFAVATGMEQVLECDERRLQARRNVMSVAAFWTGADKTEYPECVSHCSFHAR
jgi:hypothetical protein